MEKRVSVIIISTLLLFGAALPVMGITSNKIKNNFVNEKEHFKSLSSQQTTQQTDDDWDFWSDSPNMYMIPFGNIGIGSVNPTVKLDVEVISGGAATIGSSTNTATGKCAIALGAATTASKNYSIAMGHFSTASGLTSTAMGWGTTASGCCSTAMGEDTTAGGSFSTAMGRSITVNGNYSVGIGLDSAAYTVDSSNVVSIMGGKLGIGTTNPIYLLDIFGSNEIVAKFSGRVIGSDAINDNEFITKGQVESIVTGIIYTPTGTVDPHGVVGDIAYDEYYFYVKTNDGWKRTQLEKW